MEISAVLEDLHAEIATLKQALVSAEEKAQTEQKKRKFTEDELIRVQTILKALQHKLFGNRKSEKIPLEDLLPFLEDLNELGIETDEEKVEEIEVPTHKRKKKTSSEDKLPKDCEIVETVVIPAEVEANRDDYEEIGKPEITDKPNIIPAKFVIERTIRPRFRKKSDRGIPPLIAKAPQGVLPGCQVGLELLVHVITSKYVDHCPLYRLEQIFQRRYQAKISRKTMVDWIRKVAEDHLSILYESLHDELLQENYLHADETPVKCQDPDTKGKSRNGYLWAIANEAGVILYRWDLRRSKDAAKAILKGFEGLLQTDGYAVYPSLTKELKIVLLGCMAHARRKFKEAWDQKQRGAAPYLKGFASLYHIETQIREEGLDASIARSQYSLPILKEMQDRLQKEVSLMVPGKLKEAGSYFLGQFTELSRYVVHPEASIDNNVIEQGMRPVKLGAKNWLFVGHPEAGQRAAILYTILENCRRANVNPEDYLRDVLPRIAALKDDPKAIQSLHPHRWKKQA